MAKVKVDLGSVQETLLIPLWARAEELTQPDPILRDPKSAEILHQIDYDFSKLKQAKIAQVGCCLRGQIFDGWVNHFLQENPTGICVEIGAGLNTRFERVDNGQVEWFDLDLPDSMALRKHFFTESDRRRLITASILESDWVSTVKAIGDRPIMFMAEGVLIYLTEPQVQQVLALLLDHFPGAYLAFDSMSPFMVKNQKRNSDAIKFFDARFQWGIQDIYAIEAWNPQYQILETRIFSDLSSNAKQRIDFFNTLLFKIPPFKTMYRLNLCQLGSLER
jgi:O-methyltransferase involved in polyketide biosynthesis